MRRAEHWLRDLLAEETSVVHVSDLLTIVVFVVIVTGAMLAC
ncbi:MAG: hypothetical protein AAF581_11005 [Planctomycetota bacterium]